MSTINSTVIEQRQSPGCLIQLLWFALVGIWAGEIWVAVAWLFMVSIIGIPIGVWMLERTSKVMALREPPERIRVSTRPDGSLFRREVELPQVNFLLRAIYFLLIGWWLTAIWIEVAYAISLTIIGLPLGFWMFDVVPSVLTLKRQ